MSESQDNTGSVLESHYETLFHGCANVRLAVALTPIINLMQDFRLKLSDTIERLRIVEVAVSNLPCLDAHAGAADSDCRARLEKLFADRSLLLTELEQSAKIVADASTSLVKDTTKATKKLFKVLKGIEDLLHQIKGLVKDLRENKATLASEALEGDRKPLNHVLAEAVTLRNEAKKLSNLTMFGPLGMSKVRMFLGTLAVAGVFFGLAFLLDPHWIMHYKGHTFEEATSELFGTLVGLLGFLALIFSLGTVLDFLQHVARCRRGPEPYELIADKEQLAYARAVIAAAEAAAKA